jgi:UDP-N-acetylglucosamine 2-epimerase (non-hydrolysing)
VRTVLVAFGTRPEAIKMAPVVAALRARADAFRVVACATAQHRGLLDQVLARFDLAPEVDLDLMRPGQSPAEVAARVLEAMPRVLREHGVDLVLVQGDTTTALATALAAFYARVEVGHVEAGLRSGRLDAPFPEEMNRVVVDRLARWLWPPTPAAAENLRHEGCADDRRLVTGNTAIDALLWMRERVGALELPVRARFGGAARLVLVTAHRRESFGAPLERILGALERLAWAHPEVEFVYPVHPNPQVVGPAERILTAPNLHRIAPVDYAELVWLLGRSELVISDSGGLQEEAPTLGKPLLVLREVTERPEVVDAGAALLVGSDAERIEREATRLLESPEARAALGGPRMLFGDGRAAERIAAHLAGETVEPWRAPAVRGVARA